MSAPTNDFPRIKVHKTCVWQPKRYKGYFKLKSRRCNYVMSTLYKYIVNYVTPWRQFLFHLDIIKKRGILGYESYLFK